MMASDVMSQPVFVVGAEDTVAHARHLMLKHKISRLPIVEGTRLAGIITKKDIAYRLRQTDPIWRRRPIDRIPVHVLMVPDPVFVSPDTRIREVASLMLSRDISGLPVVEKGALAGIVTKSDILKSESVNHIGLTVKDMMGDVVTANRYHSLDHIIDLMRQRNDRIVVVNDDGTLAGIITESNIAFFEYTDVNIGVPEKDVTILRRQESGGRKQYRYVRDVSAVAEDIMSRPVITIAAGAPISDAVALMRTHHITSVVVVDGRDLKGILTRDDIIREVGK
jgi:CBS domain-containing protein